MKPRKSLFVLLALLFLLPALSRAEVLLTTLSFDCITNNLAADCATGEAQLSVELYEFSASSVVFKFVNAGPDASSIADVYFDDGELLNYTLALLWGSPGVDFAFGAAPPDLPGGNTISPPFVVSGYFFSADSNPPAQPNGANPGEWLKIQYFDVSPAAVLADLGDGSLRIGLHVQGYEGGGSEAFVNNPAPIPEPASLLLFGSGLIGVAHRLARRRRS